MINLLKAYTAHNTHDTLYWINNNLFFSVRQKCLNTLIMNRVSFLSCSCRAELITKVYEDFISNCFIGFTQLDVSYQTTVHRSKSMPSFIIPLLLPYIFSVLRNNPSSNQSAITVHHKSFIYHELLLLNV